MTRPAPAVKNPPAITGSGEQSQKSDDSNTSPAAGCQPSRPPAPIFRDLDIITTKAQFSPHHFGKNGKNLRYLTTHLRQISGCPCCHLHLNLRCGQGGLTTKKRGFQQPNASKTCLLMWQKLSHKLIMSQSFMV